MPTCQGTTQLYRAFIRKHGEPRSATGSWMNVWTMCLSSHSPGAGVRASAETERSASSLQQYQPASARTEPSGALLRTLRPPLLARWREGHLPPPVGHLLLARSPGWKSRHACPPCRVASGRPSSSSVPCGQSGSLPRCGAYRHGEPPAQHCSQQTLNKLGCSYITYRACGQVLLGWWALAHSQIAVITAFPSCPEETPYPLATARTRPLRPLRALCP